jgi:hypothetical protein
VAPASSSATISAGPSATISAGPSKTISTGPSPTISAGPPAAASSTGDAPTVSPVPVHLPPSLPAAAPLAGAGAAAQVVVAPAASTIEGANDSADDTNAPAAAPADVSVAVMAPTVAPALAAPSSAAASAAAGAIAPPSSPALTPTVPQISGARASTAQPVGPTGGGTATGRRPRAASVATPANASLATSDVAASPGGGHDPPTVTLTVPLTSTDTCRSGSGGQCLDSAEIVATGVSSIGMSAQSVAGAGAVISSVAFQYSPYGANAWVTFQTSSTASASASFFAAAFGLPSGQYQVRAVATDNAGGVGVSSAITVVYIASGDAYVDLAPPGSVVRGTIQLRAAPAAPGSPYNQNFAQPDTVTFQLSASGAGQWTTLGTVSQAVDGAGNLLYDTATGAPLYIFSLDTTMLPDGTYDFRVEAQDANEDIFGYVYVGSVDSGVFVDNTAPTVTFVNPGASLTGAVTLSAQAADSGSGIASVKFEISPAGAGAWSTIGVTSSTPYEQTFDTRGLQNGLYDLRVTATDAAGNSAQSAVVAAIPIINPTAPTNPDGFTITDYVVPATAVSLLGSIADSPDGETWAYGYTTAPTAVGIDGKPLVLAVHPGDEAFVLLRFTTATGWQIADVLRNSDGSPYQLGPGLVPGRSAVASGQMAPSGEAWLMFAYSATAPSGASTTTTAVFHRVPGGEFLLDPTACCAANSALAPVLAGSNAIQFGAPPTLTVGEDPSGAIYGLLLNPSQTETFTVANGSPIRMALQYGSLAGGTWSALSAPLPIGYDFVPGDLVTLAAAAETTAGNGWALISVLSSSILAPPRPLLLAKFSFPDSSSDWAFVGATGLDALDLTSNFAAGKPLTVTPLAISVDSFGVWIEAKLVIGGDNTVIALFDPATAHVVASWCGTAVMSKSIGCALPLDPNHPAAVPAAEFDTPSGAIALAQGNGVVDVYAYGSWTSVAASGFGQGTGQASLFTGPGSGWLAGTYALGLITPQPPAAPLAPWPQANENTLTSVAIPPGGGGIATSGALAVGLGGTALHYDAVAGWLVDPLPIRARSANLFGVAFNGPLDAAAVGSFGTILEWNGTTWLEDPQSMLLTQAQLNAVAFGSDGQGWAVGTFGTILHYDGTSWSLERLDAADSGANITSVTVAGSQVFAVAGGTLIMRAADGMWDRVDPALLPSSLPDSALTLVSGLPDGGLVAAGKSVVIVRASPGSGFQYSSQPIDGIAVALAAFRDPASGEVRAFVSVAPPVLDASGNPTDNVGGLPAGDGELLLDTGAGWEDLSQDQYPATALTEEGVPQPNPVLAVATASAGSSAWAVGGYSGTKTASGAGFDVPLQSRPAGVQTASIWRYDVGGSAVAPTLTQAQVTLPAQPNTVSFAFFSGMECNVQCAAVQGAQPNTNLAGATAEIGAFGAQPGGPAFAMLGGDAVGPSSQVAYQNGNGATDLADLHNYLSGLGGLPLYAAYGPLDSVPTSANPGQPWGDTFAQSPAPFGLGAAPAGISPVDSGGANGAVHHYYSFDVTQNGGTLRVIVLDNSAGSLERTIPGQTAWLDQQLASAEAASLPVVVICALPLDSFELGSASDADAVAAKLQAAGVLAVFTTNPTNSDVKNLIPFSIVPTGLQIPEYEGASLGYQQAQNDGVLWYDVSVDTIARTVTVKGIPVVQSLALEPLAGLTVVRSSTLVFQAIGRRPPGTVPSFYNYVSIPAPSCSGCVVPSYSFKSSIPGIGTFVMPSGPGSLFPLLDASGNPIPSSTSGLFCAYNAGTTTVSVTSGLLTSSLKVTVLPGDIGRPCGTVAYAPDEIHKTVGGAISYAPGTSVSPPAPAPLASSTPAPLPIVPPPPPAPAPVAPLPSPPAPPPPKPPLPAPLPVIPSPVAATPLLPAALVAPVVLVPPIPPAATPIPPGGATATSAAKREEKARKHARQSAYTTRPAGASGFEWFFGAVAAVGVIAALLAAEGLGPGPRRQPREGQEAWEVLGTRPRRRRR